MIKILDNTKALNTLVNDNTNGLGRFEALTALITEELNGVYEAEITLLDTDKHFNDLNVNSILKMPVNESGNEQMFRVYFISKPINHVVTIKCQHITYDLSKVAVKPFSATGATNSVNALKNNILGTYPFNITTNISNASSKFTLDIPRSFRECLGGYEGSLLDVFRGEYEWDNLTVKMLGKRGSDNNVRIAYGKNLTDFTQEENIENVYTSVLGYAVVNEKTYTGNIFHKVSATYPKVMIVDFSSDYQNEQVPTTADLTTKAQQYAQRNDIEVPNVNITISFVPLYQTEEYKDIAPLERVSLGDTVHVFFESLNVEASSRVIKTVWNVNLGRYDAIELGSAKANLNTVLNEVVEQTAQSLNENSNFLESQLNDMASLIINGLGLHKTLVDTGDGAYRIYLHNKTTLAESDTQYIFTSEGFLVSTDFGQTWNAGFDSEGNAILNSLATITLKALEISGGTITGNAITGGTITGSEISGGTITGGEIYGATIQFGSDITNVIAKTNDSNNGVEFKGNGTIDLKSQGALTLENYNSNNVAQNGFYLSGANTTTKTIQLVNANNSILANMLQLQAKSDINEIAISNGLLNKNANANKITLSGKANTNSFSIENYSSDGSRVGNAMTLSYTNGAGPSFYIWNYDENNNLKNTLQMNSGGSLLLESYYDGISTGNYIELSSKSSSTLNSLIISHGNGTNLSQITFTDGRIDITASKGVYVNGNKIG